MGKMSIVVTVILLAWTACQSQGQQDVRSTTPTTTVAISPAAVPTAKPTNHESVWCAELLNGANGTCQVRLAICQRYRAWTAQNGQYTTTECTPRATAYCVTRRRANHAALVTCFPALDMCRNFQDITMTTTGVGTPVGECAAYTKAAIQVLETHPETAGSIPPDPRWWCAAKVDGSPAFCWRGQAQCRRDADRTPSDGAGMQDCAAHDVAYCIATKGTPSSGLVCSPTLAICTSFRDLAAANPTARGIPVGDCTERR